MDSEFRHIQEKLRREYSSDSLTDEKCQVDAIEQFREWFNQALRHEEGEVNAMSLSTVSSDGQVSSRMVLLKDFSEQGFVFFTNYLSRKGEEITTNPKVALLFYWPRLERQVRIEGGASKVAPALSDRYFAQRPRKAQLGATVSKQSAELVNRLEFERDVAKLDTELGASCPRRPTEWGGYQVAPNYFEFWQGREDRLHDRVTYSLVGSNWVRRRLYP